MCEVEVDLPIRLESIGARQTNTNYPSQVLVHGQGSLSIAILPGFTLVLDIDAGHLSGIFVGFSRSILGRAGPILVVVVRLIITDVVAQLSGNCYAARPVNEQIHIADQATTYINDEK